MKVLLSGGGTAGHVNPALAIADLIKAHDRNAEIAFVGTKKGIENRLCEKAGYPVYHIEMKGLKRSLSLSNIKTAYYYFTAPRKAKKLLLEYKPDIVIGTGGYVCWPLLSAAAKLGIPTALHESNAIPGKAVRMLADNVDRIYVNFASTMDYFPDKSKVLFVGNPMMKKSTAKIPENIREILSIPAGTEKIILSFGGSLGARRVNEVVADLCAWEQKEHKPVLHIHATGQYGVELFQNLEKEKGFAPGESLVVKEYINNMPELLAAADLVISRAGALTLAELEAEGRAAILIPSPNVAENHQYYNAMELQKAGAAVVIEEKDLTGEKLVSTVSGLLAEPGKLAAMGRNARTLSVDDSLDRIADALMKLVKTP